MPWANDDISRQFAELAELYTLRGGDDFRVRAYQRAARALSGHGGDLAGLSERELAAIPGVGKAVAAKRVAGLPGMGSRTEANLRRALERLAAMPPGIPIADALPLAEALRDQLRAVAGVDRVEVAGSLRRMRATVHDLDLLAAGAEPARITRAFAGLPGVAEVAALGDTKVSVRTRHGFQVDLRVVRPEVWGAALQYFTGSKEHNVKVRELAVKAGLKLSEYGLFERDGELVVAEEESVVYRRLGLEWVPPELREDRGEVEAARRGAVPPLVGLADVGGDLHCHTHLSPDGTASAAVMAAAAKALGYRFLAVTDHAERLSLGGASREALLAQREHLRAVRRRVGGIELLHGAELNIGVDGSLDYDDEFLDGFDVLVASVHDRLDQPREELTARLVAACEHPAVNVIGHPTGRRIGSRAASDVDLEALYAAAARTGTALEVNGSPHRLDLGDEQVRLAHRHGVWLSFGSDSHGPGHLPNMRFAVATARRGWTAAYRVVNALPPDQLRRFLAKGRAGRGGRP